jgi:hypothetical protein
VIVEAVVVDALKQNVGSFLPRINRGLLSFWTCLETVRSQNQRARIFRTE